LVLSGVVEADEVYQTSGLKGKFKRAGTEGGEERRNQAEALINLIDYQLSVWLGGVPVLFCTLQLSGKKIMLPMVQFMLFRRRFSLYVRQ